MLELTAGVFGLSFQLDLAKCLNNSFNFKSLSPISAGQWVTTVMGQNSRLCLLGFLQ
jgi:hypothetical protein